MASVTVTMRRTRDQYNGAVWAPADIRRPRKPGRCQGVRLPARSSAGQRIVAAMHARCEGLTVERDGRQVRLQIWAEHPWTSRVWLKVYEGDALFPGEMLVGDVDRDGRICAVGMTPYTARGERAQMAA